MPGRLFLASALDGLCNPPRFNIAPGQELIVLTADGFKQMRWGLIPVGRRNARGRPVMETIINARSETVFDKSAFANLRRAVVPVDGWYEWTGKARKKQPWRIRRKDRRLIYFAAVYDVWKGPNGVEVPQVATITCPPSADLRNIHHRMGVILEKNQIPDWLSLAEDDVKPLMKPYPNGHLSVCRADDVDWTGV